MSRDGVGREGQQPLHAPVANARECGLEVGWSADLYRLQLQPELARHGVDLGHLLFRVAEIGGRVQQRHARQSRHGFCEQFEPFPTQFGECDGEARDIASGARQALRPAFADRVAAADGDDRDRRRGASRGSQRRRAAGDDDRDVQRHKLGGQGRQSFGSTVGIARLDHEVLPRDPPLLVQRANEAIERAGAGARRCAAERQQADPGYAKPRLRPHRSGVAGEGGAERQQQKSSLLHPIRLSATAGMSRAITGSPRRRATALARRTR